MQTFYVSDLYETRSKMNYGIKFFDRIRNNKLMQLNQFMKCMGKNTVNAQPKKITSRSFKSRFINAENHFVVCDLINSVIFYF